ncbi:MAG TPA: TPM domain-containing protein [Thermoanaerobaculia bacterium]|nr:TPM domain-containing protein [Thermoanaerobaculia bacterium]
MIPLRSLSAAFFLVAAFVPAGARAAAFDQIPSPRPTGWVTDLTGTLPLQTVAELNRVGDQVQAQTGAEMAVVVIGSTDGAPARDLAARLLTSWEIGETGKGNGLLLFVAVDDGATEIALGEGIRDAARLWESQAVLRMEMAPRFRRGDAVGAILQGAAACARRLLSAQVTVAMPAAGDPLPSPVVAGAPVSTAPAVSTSSGAQGGLGLLLGIGLLCGGLLAAWGIALKLLHAAPRAHRRRMKLARLDPAVGDATGSW